VKNIGEFGNGDHLLFVCFMFDALNCRQNMNIRASREQPVIMPELDLKVNRAMRHAFRLACHTT